VREIWRVFLSGSRESRLLDEIDFLPQDFCFDRSSGQRDLEIYQGHRLYAKLRVNPSTGVAQVFTDRKFGSFRANPDFLNSLFPPGEPAGLKSEYHVRALKSEDSEGLSRLKKHLDNIGIFYSYSEFHEISALFLSGRAFRIWSGKFDAGAFSPARDR